MAELHQPGLPAQLQHLHEQPGQRRKMALAEVADRAEVRPVQPVTAMKSSRSSHALAIRREA